jgi:hypothetical protein
MPSPVREDVMQLLAPDILAEARGLSPAISGAGLVVGLALWALGWWGHRFWIVLATTVVAGVYALSTAPVAGVQPLVVALLLAVSAGALALPLSRVVAFTAGGLALRLLVHASVPSLDEPLICFLVGGLLGLVLFRFWTMALTSFAGALLMGYCGLCLAGWLGRLDAVDWSTRHHALLNWGCGGVAVVGWLTQFLLERWRVRGQLRKQEEEQNAGDKEKKDHGKRSSSSRKGDPSWWGWGQKQDYRRAG